MKRIVVVDDDREIATAVRDLLVPAGFAVDTPSGAARRRSSRRSARCPIS